MFEILSALRIAVPDAAPEICECCFELMHTNASHVITLFFKVCKSFCFCLNLKQYTVHAEWTW